MEETGCDDCADRECGYFDLPCQCECHGGAIDMTPLGNARDRLMQELDAADEADREAAAIALTEIPSPCLEEAHQVVRAHSEGDRLDAGFDGGEFSGPAHFRKERQEIEELAGRYGVDPDELHEAVHAGDPLSPDEEAGWADSQERGDPMDPDVGGGP